MSSETGFDRFMMVTTPILQGVEIEEYLGPVIVRDVRAINVIRDFFTRFRDFFGGRSGAYQEVLDDMFHDLLTEMRRQAEDMGADAVVGLRVDFESVGAKRTSLVMGVVQGTAVRIV
ncbi:MAG: heavy metal-binding domain-containing protein [Candidatus Brocadiia bacterium]